MGAYDDWFRHQQEDAMEAFLEESIRNISEGAAREYLGTYGDAIEERAYACLRQAEDLYRSGYYGPALALSATATEVVIRFFLLRPLIPDLHTWVP